MKLFRLLLLVSLALTSLSLQGADKRYKNPVIFQRQEVDPATGKTVLNGKLWVMEADGSGLRQVTTGGSYDEHSSLYSDLEHVLYAEFQGGSLNYDHGGRLVKLDLYTGKHEIVAEKEGCSLHHATISPLGDDLIAYHRDCGKRRSQWVGLGDQAYEIAMRATNGVRTRDGIISMHEKNDAGCCDGREVALVHIRGRGADTTAEFLTDDKVLNRRPAISPDAKLMAWQTNLPDGGEDEIYLANIDGSNALDLTNAKGNDGHPWFSRDGKWIVFESDRSGHWEIWRMNADGSNVIQLTDGKGKYISTRARM